jgi:predicted DNA-binding transcriptional regulator AlpA
MSRVKHDIATDLKQFDVLPDSAVIRLPVVAALFGCSYSTIWRGVKKGTIPQPTKYLDRVTGWKVGQIREALKGAVVFPN